MIIRHGVIARSFADFPLRDGLLLFAGSVNNSAEKNEEIIQMEEASVADALLRYPEVPFLYFSSCSIADTSVIHTPYVKHKIRMERMVQNAARHFFIFRLPQIIGCSNTKSSLVNYLVDAISTHKTFELWRNANKNIIDIADVCAIVGEVLNRNTLKNKVINMASTRHVSMLELVNDIENVIGCRSKYVVVDRGTNTDIDVSDIRPVIDSLDINFDDNYIKRLVMKYFYHTVQDPRVIDGVLQGRCASNSQSTTIIGKNK